LFHDSPGFESGDERQLKDVQDFIAKHAKATEVEDQLHAIWPVPQSYLFKLPFLTLSYRFCFTPDFARPLLGLEQRFFNEKRAGNGFLLFFCCLSCYSDISQFQ